MNTTEIELDGIVARTDMEALTAAVDELAQRKLAGVADPSENEALLRIALKKIDALRAYVLDVAA